MPATTVEIVKKARKEFSKARTKRRNLRLHLYQGRNRGGESYVMDEYNAELLIAELPRNLQGNLRSEHQLALRISENADIGERRPELRARINRLRREIKAQVDR